MSVLDAGRRFCRRTVLGGSPWVRGTMALLILCPGVFGSRVLADESADWAAEMLNRMSEALSSHSYEGTLVYQHRDQLEALHLVHRIENGEVRERLLSLNGPIRAVTREQDRVTCVLPDGHPIFVKRHAGSSGLLQAGRIDFAALNAHYQVSTLGSARVAGRETDIVVIRPLDSYRYGYRFYLDRESGMPLKTDLIDEADQTLEQLMFTSIRFSDAGEPTPDAPAEPAAAAATLEVEPGGAPSGWRFAQIPSGFAQVMRDTLTDPAGAEVEHFLFSDKLSSYSVYIEADAPGGLTGSTRIGAVNAAGRQIGGHQVTAVGEVPVATVEAAVAGASPILGDGR